MEQGGSLWQSLTEEQKQQVLLAFEESEDEDNLVSFEEIQAKYKEWSINTAK